MSKSEQEYQKQRQSRGLVIAATSKIQPKGDLWLVPSQSGRRKLYEVDPFNRTCTCPDNKEHGHKCKHLYAVEIVIKREFSKDADNNTVETTSITVEKKTKFVDKRDWEKYNAAQIDEKRHFLPLLRELCSGFPEPDRPKGGRPPIPIADRLYAICWKVWLGKSSRKCGGFLDELVEKGFLSQGFHPNKINSFMEHPELTQPLRDMIIQSSLPMRNIEKVFAPDGSGYSVSKFIRWQEEKYPKKRSGKDWVKIHLVCGTKTKIVTAAVVEGRDANDSPIMPELLDITKQNFEIKEWCADNGYLSVENIEAVFAAGGRPYIAFTAKNTGAAGGLFGKMYDFWLEQHQKFLDHYHQRSIVESVHSMIKRKFGYNVSSNTTTAMKNEVFAKVVCHNLCCLIRGMYESGLSPKFWQDGALPEDKTITVDVPLDARAMAILNKLPSYEDQVAAMFADEVADNAEEAFSWL